MMSTEKSLSSNRSLEDRVISKEKAVFWMDGQGRWHNRHGRFEHKRIIEHFNRSIRRDAAGYYVTQIRGGVREKVYFCYAETPLFALDLAKGVPMRLLLNTGETVPLDPGGLFVESDHLYQSRGDERIKFTDRAMLTLAPYLDEDEDDLILCIGSRRWPIARQSPLS